jgi:hypothetical protein
MNSLCQDCGFNTTPCTGKRGCRHGGKWEWYMVRDAVWTEARAADGYLCIGCLERRLGRPLTSEDFSTAPVNNWSPWDTDRLMRAKFRIEEEP